MYNAVIVEDEMHSRELLRNMVAMFCTDIQVIATAASVNEGVTAIKTHKPDIVFLDIEMQTGTGFDLLQQFPQPEFDVIFTTAFNHYAVKAIKFSAVDYLLKPIDPEELRAAVDKVLVKRKDNVSKGTLEVLMNYLKKQVNTPQTITLATADGHEFIPLQDIIYIEANGPYSTFFIKSDRKIMVSKNLKEYETLLSDHNFLRIHNSHIINIGEVRRMIKTDGGYAVMSNGAQLIISPKRKEDFLRMIGENNLKI